LSIELVSGFLVLCFVGLVGLVIVVWVCSFCFLGFWWDFRVYCASIFRVFAEFVGL